MNEPKGNQLFYMVGVRVENGLKADGKTYKASVQIYPIIK